MSYLVIIVLSVHLIYLRLNKCTNYFCNYAIINYNCTKKIYFQYLTGKAGRLEYISSLIMVVDAEQTATAVGSEWDCGCFPGLLSGV